MLPERLSVLDEAAADPDWYPAGVAALNDSSIRALPWLMSITELVVTNRVSSWFGLKETVEVDADILGLGRRPWHHDLAPDRESPTHEFSTDVWLVEDDVRENVAAVRSAIDAELGEGSGVDVSNTLETQWHAGFVTVSALAFPRDMQSSASSNQLYDRNPRLWDSVQVRVMSALADPRPRPDLATRRQTASVRVAVEPAMLPLASLVRTHVHAVSRDGLGVDSFAGHEIWADEVNIVVGARRLSIVSDRTDVVGLRHLVATPARGGGWSEVQAVDRRGSSVCLARMWDHRGLDDVAARLGEQLDLPVGVDRFESD